MRTKDDIAIILAKRKFNESLNASTWDDLVKSINSYTPEQKASFIRLLVNGNSKKVGDRLKQALHDNAKNRAKSSIDSMLADDRLSIAELDLII